MSSNTTNLSLYKANPITNPTDTFNIDTILNANWDKIDAVIGLLSTLSTSNKTSLVLAINEIINNEGALSSLTTTAKSNLVAAINELNNSINNANITVPSITYGMNSKITNTGKVSVSPKITIQGKSYFNATGKDGNCEDVSKWADNGTTHALDSTNKVFGGNGIKITLTTILGGIYIALPKSVDVTKYYLISAYVKNGNATDIFLKKDNTSGGNNVSSSLITDTTKFNRIGIVVQPTDLNISNFIFIRVDGAIGQYAYVDGIMVNEITSAEYALGATTLLANYPYIDSYSCLQNPYIEIKHDNLFRNGNCEEGIAWYTPNNTNSTLSIVSGKFQLVTNATGGGSQLNKINVKANTDYYLSGNISGSTTLSILASDGTTVLKSGVGTFNSGGNTVIYGAITNASTSQTGTADSIMLVEGTTASTSYKSCRLERTVIEGKFTSDDSFVYDNGEVTGSINWKHKVLFGKDYDWQMNSDYVGYKAFFAPLPVGYISDDSSKCIASKYDGKMLKYQLMANATDSTYMTSLNGVWVSASDTDTGWAETINPNNDEVKAFMNGWKAIYNNGTRYCAWVSIVDGSVPNGSIQAGASATTNTTALTVTSNGTAFVSGDIVAVITATGTLRGTATVTGTPTATNIPLTSSLSVVSGDIVVKADNGSTNISLLTWCKNNIAPNYEGYQLHYKLANPEVITDVNTHIHGDIPLLDVGDNYLYLDSGIALGEVVNPLSNGTYYYLSYNKLSSVVNTPLKYKDEIISSIYKNNIYDFSKWIQLADDINNSAYYIPIANFDTNAVYTVDYKILSTQAPQVGTIGCSYSQDIVSAINKLEEEVNNKQEHDSILDTLVDLSVYETGSIPSMVVRAGLSIGYALSSIYVKFSARKKTIPVITLSSLLVTVRDNTGTNITITPDVIRINSVTVDGFIILISINTGTNATYSINNGSIMTANFTADCRGRI